MGLVRAPEGVAKALKERSGAREEIEALFAGDERMSAVERLELYAGMYFFRLRDSLAEDFARTAAALGEARWHNLVTDYLLAHPPTSWSLRWAGEALPEFLRAHAYGAERPWLSDVAALEQARNEAFQALDATPLRPEELAFIARLLEKFDAYAVCDEVYEHLVFDGRAHHVDQHVAFAVALLQCRVGERFPIDVVAPGTAVAAKVQEYGLAGLPSHFQALVIADEGVVGRRIGPGRE